MFQIAKSAMHPLSSWSKCSVTSRTTPSNEFSMYGVVPSQHAKEKMERKSSAYRRFHPTDRSSSIRAWRALRLDEKYARRLKKKQEKKAQAQSNMSAKITLSSTSSQNPFSTGRPNPFSSNAMNPFSVSIPNCLWVFLIFFRTRVK
jgi:hypothetical protein